LLEKKERNFDSEMLIKVKEIESLKEKVSEKADTIEAKDIENKKLGQKLME